MPENDLNMTNGAPSGVPHFIRSRYVWFGVYDVSRSPVGCIYVCLLATFLWQLLRSVEQAVLEGQSGIVHMLWDLSEKVLQTFVDIQPVHLGGIQQAVNLVG